MKTLETYKPLKGFSVRLSDQTVEVYFGIGANSGSKKRSIKNLALKAILPNGNKRRGCGESQPLNILFKFTKYY